MQAKNASPHWKFAGSEILAYGDGSVVIQVVNGVSCSRKIDNFVTCKIAKEGAISW
jgi:hypothetical protein